MITLKPVTILEGEFVRPCTEYHECAYSVSLSPPRICKKEDGKCKGRRELTTHFTAKLQGQLSEFYLDEVVWCLDHGVAIRKPDAIFIHNYDIFKHSFDMIFILGTYTVEFTSLIAEDIQTIRNWYQNDIFSMGENTISGKMIIDAVKRGESYESIVATGDSESEWFPDDY